MGSDYMKHLEEIVGSQYVSAEIEDCIQYVRDMASSVTGIFTSGETFIPECVVLPGSVEEVQAIVRLACSHRIPIYPYAFGTNVSGMAIPCRKGGITLVLRRLNRVLEVNPETMTATIEPGVTWGLLRKEARKVGLELPSLAGPYAGSILANFLAGNISAYSAMFGFFDRLVSLEVVLPNGELLRTGSQAFRGHEVVNPYFRYAYGPDITGVFRGSLGSFGIVTKGVYRLFALGDAQDYVCVGFLDIDSAVAALKEIERYGLSCCTFVLDRAQIAHISAPDVEQLKNPFEVRRLESFFPEYCLIAMLNGTREQVALYEEMVEGVASRWDGVILNFTGRIRENLNDLVPGAGIRINRMFMHPSTFLITVTPISKVCEIRRKTIELARDKGLRDPFTGEFLVPPVFLIPIDRGTNVYLEQDIAIETENPERTAEFMMSCMMEFVSRHGATWPVLTPALEFMISPAYMDVLRGIKDLLDPNHVLSPGKLVREEE